MTTHPPVPETQPLLPVPLAERRGAANTKKMQRSSTFVTTPGRAKTLKHPFAELREDHVSGPITWLNPTRARFNLTGSKDDDTAGQTSDGATRSKADWRIKPVVDGAQVEWRARDNRKGE
jgi:hypothetical protein